MEPREHVPKQVRVPLNRREFLGVSLGTSAGIAAAAAFSPGLARAQQPIDRAPSAASTKKAMNVIFMVSDGMSFGTLSLAEIVSRARHSRGTHWVGLWGRPDARRSIMRTASADSAVTDSAAASSAWGCGEHIDNDRVNFAPDKRRPTPILVQAKQNGKATGLVTTTRVTHATPAGFIANAVSRNFEEQIASQILERRVDVVLGGGSKFFPKKLLAERPDVRVLNDVDGFAAYMGSLGAGEAQPPVLGIFNGSHCKFECDRGQTEPALKDMAAAALAHLSRSSNGFVLQIEGGRVDHAAHANDAGALVGEQLAFDATLGVVLDWMNGRDDTLLIVTTDHGNANPGLTLYGSASYQGVQRLILTKYSFEWLFEQFDLKIAFDDPVEHGKILGEERVSTLVREATGVTLSKEELGAFVSSLRSRPHANFEAMASANCVLGSCLANYLGVGFISPNHTSDFVEVAAVGPGSEGIAPFIDNVDLHRLMTGALDLAPAKDV